MLDPSGKPTRRLLSEGLEGRLQRLQDFSNVRSNRALTNRERLCADTIVVAIERRQAMDALELAGRD